MDFICDFTGSYLKIPDYSRVNDIISFRDLTGTNGYCSDEAADEIRKRLAGRSYAGTHYIDDGNHHYFSKFFLEKIEMPFDLFVFDHHTDMQPSALLPVLSCGNWILESMEKIPNLRNVIVCGVPKEAYQDVDTFGGRVTFIDEISANTGDFISHEGDLPVYISVDNDVLSPSEFKSIWDQGSMTLTRLNCWIDYIHANNKVLGMDICG